MAASLANGKSYLKVRLEQNLNRLLGSLTNHVIASDHIRNLENGCKIGREAQVQLQQTGQDLEAVRRENETLRNENHHLFHEMQHYREQLRPGTATTLHPQPSMYAAPPPAVLGDSSRSLPPLSNGVPSINSTAMGTMQGIQYTDDRR